MPVDSSAPMARPSGTTNSPLGATGEGPIPTGRKPPIPPRRGAKKATHNPHIVNKAKAATTRGESSTVVTTGETGVNNKAPNFN